MQSWSSTLYAVREREISTKTATEPIQGDQFLLHPLTRQNFVHSCVAVDTFIVYIGESVSESPWKHSL
jgi:hypothetical protein